MLHYDYTKAKAFCAECGLIWAEDWVPTADVEFQKAGLTQDQVDAMMRNYIWRMKYVFSPSTYSWKQRLGLALHFIVNLKRW